MPTVDTFAQTHPEQLLIPARSAFPITPSDTAVLAIATRGITTATAGAVSMVFMDDAAPVTVYLLQGLLYPYRVRQVRATGTDATGIVGVY